MHRRICLLATLVLCALIAAEATAAPKELAPKKDAHPPAGQVRSGKKKGRRGSKKRAEKPSAEQEDTAASQPAETDDGHETIAIVLSRLARTRRAKLSDRDIALKTGLEFVRALGRADGQKAAGLLEVTGYQTMPASGELPDEPGPRIGPEAFAADVTARKPAPFETLPADCVDAVGVKSLRPAFPAVAAWMLPSDWAVILKPVADRPEWVQQEACLVIRVRANKPTIQGGTALDAALGTAPAESPAAQP